MKYGNILILLFATFIFSCKNKEVPLKVDTTKKNEVKQDTVSKPKYPSFLNIDFLMGKFDPAKHHRFVRIEGKYTNKHNVYLDKAAYHAFLRMYDAAYKDGFKLLIVSATRPFNYQKGI